VLTKRSSPMRTYLRRRYDGREPPPHIWLGVSVEDGLSKARVEHLRTSPAAVRFLSVEPLIGPIGKIDLTGIHWSSLVVRAALVRDPMHIEWAREIRDECADQGVAFFFKQWEGYGPSRGAETWMGASGTNSPYQWGETRRMTPPPIERYAGREQAYIKHFLLASYLEPFVHKIGSKYDQIVYVDGFSGLGRMKAPTMPTRRSA
jgi:hypothetical protein